MPQQQTEYACDTQQQPPKTSDYPVPEPSSEYQHVLSHSDSIRLPLPAIQARSTARIPVKNTPSKVPAPPMDTTGAPSPLILWRFMRSAPTSVPIVPATYAVSGACSGASSNATSAALSGGIKSGTAIPTPRKGRANQCVTIAMIPVAMITRSGASACHSRYTESSNGTTAPPTFTATTRSEERRVG